MVRELIIILVLILANGVFAGAEIAVVAVRQSRLAQLSEQGRRGVGAVLALKRHPERFLATVQVGITVISATAAAFGGANVAARLVPWMEQIPGVARYAEEVAFGIVVAAVSYLSIVLGELVPKSMALRAAESYSLAIGRPLLLLATLARPLVWLLTTSSNLVLRPFGDRTTFTETRYSAEELQQLVEQASKTGTVDPRAGEIASRALDLQTLMAVDVMVPRQSVVMVPVDVSEEELRAMLRGRTHSRVPVYQDTFDNVVGYLHVKDLLAAAMAGQPLEVRAVLRPPVFVPETQPAVSLLQQMRGRRQPFVVVVDEQGGMSGIVTLEDLVEELVGEIFSEHADRIPQPITFQDDGSAIIDARLPVREVNRALDTRLPEDGDWTTTAGLCLALSGRLLGTGDVVVAPDGTTLEVADASPRRIRILRIRKAPAPESDEDAAAHPEV